MAGLPSVKINSFLPQNAYHFTSSPKSTTHPYWAWVCKLDYKALQHNRNIPEPHDVYMSDYIEIKELRRLTSLKPIMTIIKSRTLKLFGHIKRSQIGLSKLEGLVEGKRSRGRQPKQWRDNVYEWYLVWWYGIDGMIFVCALKQWVHLMTNHNEWHIIMKFALSNTWVLLNLCVFLIHKYFYSRMFIRRFVDY